MYKQIAAVIFLLLLVFGVGFQFGQQVHHYIEVPTAAYHRGVVSKFSTLEYRQQVRQIFDNNLTWMELLYFEAAIMKYDTGQIPRYDDPLMMLANVPLKGRCGEFAILYTSLLYAFNYKARLIVDITGDHVWTELFWNETWMHIDPTEVCSRIQNHANFSNRINNPLMYQNEWHKDIKQIAAFEGNIYGNVLVSDVTEFYRSD